jgi:hypothetical protein
MKLTLKRVSFPAALALAVSIAMQAPTMRAQAGQAPAFPPAKLLYVYLNSVNPSAAADYYPKAFTSATRTQWNGFEAVKSGNIYLIFNKVNTPPPAGPLAAFWHFGWNTPDSRQYVQKFHSMGLEVMQMFADPEHHLIDISSDALPGFPTSATIAEVRARGTQPSRVAGFSYLKGPDGTMIENAGNSPTEYFNHVHLYHEDPVCAQEWYVKHLGATVGGGGRGRGGDQAPADCHREYAPRSWPAFEDDGMYRDPAGGVGVGDQVQFLIRPHHGPYVSSRGHVMDHVGMSVPDLTAAVARLRGEGVKITEDIHAAYGSRVAMIEGPDLLPIELYELK